MPRYHSRTRRVKRRSIFGPIALVVVTVLIGAAVAALWNRDRIMRFADEQLSEVEHAAAVEDREVERAAAEAGGGGEPSAEVEEPGTDWQPPAGFERSEIVFRLAEARVGRVAVRSVEEEEADPELIEFFGVRAHVPEGEMRTEESFLILELEAVNRSGGRRLEIGDLMGVRSHTTASPGARLSDDGGNRYRVVMFGAEEEPRLAGSSASVGPGEVGRLGLVFEKPVPEAEELTLTIPAERFGGSGEVVLRFGAPR